MASVPDDTDVLFFLSCSSSTIKLAVVGESSKAPAPTRARRKHAIGSKKRVLDHAPPCRSDSCEFLGKVLKEERMGKRRVIQVVTRNSRQQ